MALRPVLAAAAALAGLLLAPTSGTTPAPTLLAPSVASEQALSGLAPEDERAHAAALAEEQALDIPRIDLPDYPRAAHPRRYEHSSDAFALDADMRRCLDALETVERLPLRYYRMSCAPVLEQGNSAGHTVLVGGNTYRTSEDIVIGSYLAPAALERLIKHEAAHGFLIEHRSVQLALEAWAYPERADGELSGDILDDPTPYPQNPGEVYAAAWARCHGGGPDPLVEDDRMSCQDAERITSAAGDVAR